MRLFAAFASIAGIVLVSACSGFTELGVGAGKAGVTGDAGSGMSGKVGKGGNSSGGSQGSDATSGTSGSSTGGSTADGGSNSTSGTNATGGSGSTGGSSDSDAVGDSGAGESGSNATLPRFLLISPVDPSGSLQAGREYTVWLSGASDDGSVLVGCSTFWDAATSTNDGIIFYWTEASGVVALPPPITYMFPGAYVSPDGTSLFGFYSAGVFRWTEQTGYELFVAPWPIPVPPNGVVDVSFSRDGTAAWGGYWDSTQSYAFRWRRTDGLVTSDSIPGWPADGSYDIGSDDGKVVAGYHEPSDAPGAHLLSGFIWSEPGTLAELGPLPGTSACSVSVLSRDGTTAFGSCAQDPESTTGTAFRWTASTGTVAIDTTGFYSDTTRDGRVAMGGYGTDALSRWTADSGAVRLQASPNTIDPAQYALSMTTGSLSEDGGSVFGRALRIDFQAGIDEESPEDGFRWSAAEGFVLLPPLPGYDIATVLGAAPDGSVQVGLSRSRIGGNASLPESAVMWDCLGIRDIGAELAAGGIDLPEGGLSLAGGVWSGASIMIVGSGAANGGYPWIAWLPRRC